MNNNNNMDMECNRSSAHFLNGQWCNREYIDDLKEPMEMDSTGNDLSHSCSASSAIQQRTTLSPRLSSSLTIRIPRPAQNLPPRCTSEPIHQDEPISHNDLLEDWPRRASDEFTATAQDWQSLSNCLDNSKNLRVSFSEKSSMQVYLPDPLYIRNKSYTKEERQRFGTATLSEAIRIKKLLLSTPGSSMKSSFKYLLKNNLISYEEIVGIEHLVLGNSASKIVKVRKEHARAVLLEQHRMKTKKMMDEDDSNAKMQDDEAGMKYDMKKMHIIENKLGEVAASRSSKSVKRARIRAAMAA